jgi:hypothetical protein
MAGTKLEVAQFDKVKVVAVVTSVCASSLLLFCFSR